MDVVLCYVTCPGEAEALALARRLVEERLAACGNVLPGMRSVYRWQGAVHEAGEAVLILKTRAALAEPLTARVVALHPYECPCILVLPIAGGHAAYLAWVMESAGDVSTLG